MAQIKVTQKTSCHGNILNTLLRLRPHEGKLNSKLSTFQLKQTFYVS